MHHEPMLTAHIKCPTESPLVLLTAEPFVPHSCPLSLKAVTSHDCRHCNHHANCEFHAGSDAEQDAVAVEAKYNTAKTSMQSQDRIFSDAAAGQMQMHMRC